MNGVGMEQRIDPYRSMATNVINNMAQQQLRASQARPLGMPRQFPIQNQYQAMFQNRLRQDPMQYLYSNPYRILPDLGASSSGGSSVENYILNPNSVNRNWWPSRWLRGE